VGEAQAAQPLVHALRKSFPNFRLVISTTTVSGQKIARQILAQQADAIFYFPIDWAWTVRRVLRKIQPSAIIVMETELWPRLFRESRRRQIPVVLVNGRISDRSFRRYRRIRKFMRHVLDDLTLGVMQSENDAERIRDLGLAQNRISVSGNLKFDSAAFETDERLTRELRERFSFGDGRPLIVAASTHGGEEALLLEAFKTIRQSDAPARLMFAPRNPERFQDVAALLGASGFKFARRSNPASRDDSVAAVILLDTIGELRAVYPLTEIVFVGGSLIPHGGHNVIEPARFGVCTVTGPHTQNFAGIVKLMLQADALIQLSSSGAAAAELTSVLDRLLSDEANRRRLGQRAQDVCDRNRGATEKTIGFIREILTAAQPEQTQADLVSFEATTAK
jgi:3-deoxy-D-manno-octulosonic-acid transferase